MAGESWQKRSGGSKYAPGSLGQVTDIYPYVVRKDIGRHEDHEAGALIVTFSVRKDEAHMFAILRTLYPNCAKARNQPSQPPASEDETPPTLLKVCFRGDEQKEFSAKHDEYKYAEKKRLREIAERNR